PNDRRRGPLKCSPVGMNVNKAMIWNKAWVAYHPAMRHDGRAADELRAVKITRNFTAAAAGSVLWQQGNTIVWCTASVTNELPPWMKDDRPGGWVTAEYVMLPASTPRRKEWPKIGHTDSRGTEIQRLIGRS